MRIRIGILVMVFVMLFSLCACESKEVLTLSPFSRNVLIKAGEREFSGTVHFESQNSISFEVSSPEKICNMKYSLCDGNETVSFKGTDIRLSDNEGCIFTLLYILRSLSRDPPEVKKQGKDTLCGVIHEKEYELILNCDTGEILSVQSGEYSFTFS